MRSGMDFLQAVMKEREEDIHAASRNITIDVLQERALKQVGRRSLSARLFSMPGTHIIAETKKTSPSAGLLREDYRPAAIAGEYERCGAAGISVLTEPRHFSGSLADMRAVRDTVDLPILRKDFICDPYQVYESAANGADVILLICAMLSEKRLLELYKTALSAGLEVIVESHSAEELEKALPLEKAIVGINSRNLQTLKTDLAVAKSLACYIPRGRVAIAESGIKTRDDIEELLELGYKGFLIGETLMKADDIPAVFKELTGGAQ